MNDVKLPYPIVQILESLGYENPRLTRRFNIRTGRIDYLIEDNEGRDWVQCYTEYGDGWPVGINWFIDKNTVDALRQHDNELEKAMLVFECLKKCDTRVAETIMNPGEKLSRFVKIPHDIVELGALCGKVE